MLGIIADAMRVASRTESKHDAAKRRYVAQQEKQRRDKEYYRRWLNGSGGRG